MKLFNIKLRNSSSASTTEPAASNNIRQYDKVMKLWILYRNHRNQIRHETKSLSSYIIFSVYILCVQSFSCNVEPTFQTFCTPKNIYWAALDVREEMCPISVNTRNFDKY
jgi:hypothetical protein